MSSLTGQSWLCAGFSVSCLLHWPTDKEIYSEGFISGVAVRFPSPRARRAHPTTCQSLCDASTSAHQFARSFFFQMTSWLWPSTVAFSLHVFWKHRLEQTTSRWSPRCTDLTTPEVSSETGGKPSCTCGYCPWRMLPLTYLRKTEATCNTPLFGTERSVQSIQRSRTPIWLPTCQTVFTALKSYRTQRDVINEQPILQQLAGFAPAFPKWLFKAAASCTEGTIGSYFLWNMCLPHYHTYFPLLQNFQFCIHLINTLKFMRHQCPKALEHLMFGQLAAVLCIKNIFFWYLCSITFCCSVVQNTHSA